MLKLTGYQAEQFDKALRDAFPSYELLGRMLWYKLNVRLAGIKGEDGLEEVVPAVIEWFDAKSRSDDLLRGALQDSPTHPLLVNCAASFGIRLHTDRAVTGEGKGDRVVGSQVHELFDHNSFDLRDYDREFLKALAPRPGDAGSRRLLGFAIECGESDFLACLSQRLKRWLGEKSTKEKQRLSLGWKGDNAQRVVARLARLSEDVRRNNVLCIVLLVDASLDELKDFWTRISAMYDGKLANYLALIIAGPAGTVFPQGILPLPTPQFEKWHFYEWTKLVVEYFQWDEQDLPEHWSEWIYEQSLLEGVMDVWQAYDTLKTEIEILKLMRSDPTTLLRHLKERMSHAVSTPS